MIRDEYRAKCIEAIKARIESRIDSRLNNYLCEMKPNYDDSITGFNEAWDIVRAALEDISFAFDALATVPVTVCPLEATEEMLHAGDSAFENGYVAEVFAAMSAAGDLTNAPEKKI